MWRGRAKLFEPSSAVQETVYARRQEGIERSCTKMPHTENFQLASHDISCRLDAAQTEASLINVRLSIRGVSEPVSFAPTLSDPTQPYSALSDPTRPDPTIPYPTDLIQADFVEGGVGDTEELQREAEGCGARGAELRDQREQGLGASQLRCCFVFARHQVKAEARGEEGVDQRLTNIWTRGGSSRDKRVEPGVRHGCLGPTWGQLFDYITTTTTTTNNNNNNNNNSSSSSSSSSPPRRLPPCPPAAAAQTTTASPPPSPPPSRASKTRRTCVAPARLPTAQACHGIGRKNPNGDNA